MAKPKNPKRLYPLGDSIGFVSLVDRMKQDTALKVVNSARISYAKTKDEFDESDSKLVRYLWNHEHTSPWRHTFYTFHVKAPQFTLRQWVKYQVGSYWREYEIEQDSVSIDVIDLILDTDSGSSWNELSARYAKFKPEFYIPASMRANIKHGSKQASTDLPIDFDHAGERLAMYRECEEAFKAYEQRIEAGIAKEIARMLLPQNIYSEVYWTVSLQAIIHFLGQRLKADSQLEIRAFAECIYTLVKDDLTKLGITKEGLMSE